MTDTRTTKISPGVIVSERFLSVRLRERRWWRCEEWSTWHAVDAMKLGGPIWTGSSEEDAVALMQAHEAHYPLWLAAREEKRARRESKWCATK